ncbi:MAG: molybdopterin molybdotransferase MoeA [Ketobacteraceae bacterium]|nr:molybdopterin molybdotransferase MoeA [Ketobacteraceae bacterium]
MSCCSESGLLPVPVAIQTLIDAVRAEQVPSAETLPLTEACGMTLAAPVCSPVSVPPHDNSAMDGYAIRYQDRETQPALPVSQRIPAGVAPEALMPATAARIFTGAPVPEGADTVVMQEDCILNDDGSVSITENIRQGAHIRRAGEDIREGQEILAAGHRLQACDIGLIASVGVDQVSVYRKLRVAVLVSGDELLEPGQPPEPGKIYNSNQYMLVPLLQQLGFEVSWQANVQDTFDATLEALKSAAEKADVIVTTGGVSVGEEDHLKPAVEAMGQLNLWKVNIKPGKPFAFGHVDHAGKQVPFIGLPGNPVSVFATLLVLGVPYLRTLQGQCWKPPVPVKVPAAFTVSKPGKRDEYLRVRVIENKGVACLEKYPNQSSGVLSSVAWADGFAVVKAGEQYETGDLVPFLRMDQLMHG